MSRYFPSKFFVLALSSAVLSCGLAACAIHPLPENVTGVKTSQIVHRNRCEARDALMRVQQRLIEKNRQASLETLTKIGIVLSYSLDITETDSLTASTTFEQLLTKGMFTFNPNASNVLKRENTRVFTVADDYRTLMDMRNCRAMPVGSSYQYPIVGTIGIAEMIRTFLTMALHEDLNDNLTDDTALETTISKSIAASPTMVDTLVFTTTISAGIMPTVTLTPVGSLAQLTNASLNASLMREDAHQVIVGVGLPTVPPPEGNTNKFVRYSTISLDHSSLARTRTPLLIDASVPARTALKTGQSAALEAVNNQIIRFQVLPKGVIAAP
jgi:hypothetical protein